MISRAFIRLNMGRGSLDVTYIKVGMEGNS